MNPEQNQPTLWQKTKEIATQGVIIIAAIVLVVFVAWGIIKIVPAVISSISSGASSLFSPKESIDVTAFPATVETGSPITVSWKHISRSAPGTYGISFACVPGLMMKLKNSAGGFQTIPCAKNIPLGDVTSAIIVGTSTQNRLVQFPIEIAFTDTATGAVGVNGTASVTITNDSLPFTSGSTDTSANTSSTAASDTTSTATPVKPAKTVSHAQYGKADLAITVLGTGTVDPISGQFLSQGAVNPGQKGAIRFSVKNIGTRSSGRWTWSAVLPTPGAQVYNAPAEPSLAPGSSIVFTFGFDNIISGAPLTISVDDILDVPDANRNNNAVQIPFYSSGTGYSYGNYSYGNYGNQNGSGYSYPNGTSYNYPATVTPAYGNGYGYGAPDLSVQILSVDGNASGSGYSTGYYSGTSGSHTVRVQVSNIGTATSGGWTYSAFLPISCQNLSLNNSYYGGANGQLSCNGSQAVVSGISQAALPAGGSVILTINFMSGTNSYCSPNTYSPYGYNSGCQNNYGGNKTFTFTVNPGGSYPELRTDNNTATTYVYGY